jgi:UDP-glucose 4-epimerase
VTVLVTGGAGYIGSHVVRLLRDRDEQVVIIDDLITGSAARVEGVPLVQLDLADSTVGDVLDAIFRENDIHAVIHFAARKQVGESVQRPVWYFQQNLGSLQNVLAAMGRANVTSFVFSSSAAVYGMPSSSNLDEQTPTVPINPYGETKLVGEWLVANAVRSQSLRAASLRYFNVAGAGWPELGDTAALNLVPMVFDKLDQGLAPVIFGDDYDTPDGTCIRDYVHVLDLAEAHLATLDFLRGRGPGHHIFNVGTGTGASVREMVRAILNVAGSEIVPAVRGRRPGDPSAVVADPRSIAKNVGWTASRGLSEIVASAWESRLFLRR